MTQDHICECDGYTFFVRQQGEPKEARRCSKCGGRNRKDAEEQELKDKDKDKTKD
jgi:hypothetical protein